MLKKFFVFIFIFGLLLSIAPADTNIHIIGEIILKKNKRLYIDKGRNDGVEIGHKLDILYDDQKYGSGIISWVGDDISYARVDSVSFYRYTFINPLEVRICLEQPLKYQGGALHIPYYRQLNLQPSEIITPDEQTVSCLIYDGLVKLNEQGQIVPGLAYSWEIHGNTYTFYLNTGVQFHSGKPFNAIDVAYSLVQLAKAPKVTPSTSFILEVDGYNEVHFNKKNELRGIFIPNKYTIAITTKDTFVPFLKYLAGSGGYIIPAVQNQQTLPTPIGTGPFKIVNAGDNVIKLSANENYFDASPVLDSIICYRYKNRSEAALDFELGKLDLFFFDSEDYRDFLTNGDYITRRHYTSSTVILGFNCKHDYQSDFKLSKALQFLFDKESIVRVLLNNSAQKSDGVIPPALNLESDYVPEYYFSPSDAKQKINRIAGLPDKLNLIYDYLDPALESIAGYIAGQLRQAGLKISVKGADKRELEQSADINSMDIFLFRYDMPVPDPDAFFYPLFSKRLNGQTNYLYYDNPQLERFLEGARSFDDSYTINEIYHDAEKLIMKQPPLIALYNPIMTVAYRRNLAGFTADSRAFINLQKAFFQAGK